MRLIVVLFFLLTMSDGYCQQWNKLAPPVIEGKWIHPAQNEPSQPIWGHRDGIRIGLAPMPGPRGLLRIYTPYLGHEIPRLMNFLALEPIVAGSDKRGLSELEWSRADGVRGKRFWSANDSSGYQMHSPDMPASGVLDSIDGKETLTVYIFSEKFLSGADVYVRIRFFEDRPYEMEMSTYATSSSATIDQLVVTATMGNFARLRNLYLNDDVVSSLQLWPNYTGDAFTRHEIFGQDRFVRSKSGDLYFIAAPNEENPQDAVYAPGTTDNWKYYGKKATQYWRISDTVKNVKGLVNGRYTYWGGKAPIPGGIAFENFELGMPFQFGQTFTFGISPMDPEELIDSVKNRASE